MSTFRQASKGEYDSRNTLEDINAGSLQRIADATEKMALSYAAIIDQRDLYKRWYEEERAANGKLYRRVTALRGVITRLKRAT